MKDSPLNQALVPATNALLLVAFARERGIAPDPALSDLGIQEGALSDDMQSLSVGQCIRLMQWVGQHTQEPALGYEMGLRTPSTAHGLFSLGLLSCATPQQALELATQFFEMRNPTFRLDWSVAGHSVYIALSDLMPHMPMRQTAAEWVLLSVLKMGDALMSTSSQPDTRAACELHLPWPMPAYHQAFASRLPTCHFNAARAAVSFPAAWLATQLGNAAAGSVQLARQACERDQSLRSHAITSTVLRVLGILETGLQHGAYPSREEVARTLHVSVSSLQRLLARESSSYSQLLNQVRLQHARHLLGQPGLTVEAVAARLGYDNTANFTRGFKQWTGLTPSAWRQAQTVSASGCVDVIN